MKNSLSEKWSIGKVVIRKFGMTMLLSEIRPSEIRPSEKRPSEKSRGATVNAFSTEMLVLVIPFKS